MAPGVWFSSYYSKRREKNSSAGPKRLPLTFGLSDGAVEHVSRVQSNTISHRALRRSVEQDRNVYTNIYIYKRVRPQKTNRIVYTNDTYPSPLLPTLIGRVYRTSCVCVYIFIKTPQEVL